MAKAKWMTMILALALLWGTASLSAAESPYNAKWNERRIEEITQEILRQVVVQRKAYDKALADWNSASGNGNNGQMYGGPDPGMMGPGGPGGGAPAADKPPKPVYKLDRDLIKLALRRKFPAAGVRPDGLPDPVGMLKVDGRSKVDLFDALHKDPALRREFESSRPSVEELTRKARAEADKKYPLYLPGQVVEIRFAPPHGAARTYKGVFKTLGKFKISIGNSFLNRSDLPTDLQACFDKKLNDEAKAKFIRTYPGLGSRDLDYEQFLADKLREELAKQFVKNLPQGWIYVNDSWRLPEDIVEDVIEHHQMKVNASRHHSHIRTPGLD